MNTSKNTFIALLFTLFPCLIFICGFINLLFNRIEVEKSLIPVFVLQATLVIIAFRQFLWLINGRQELTIQNKKLMLRKRGTFFTRDKIYDLVKVNNIQMGVNEDELSLLEKTVNNIRLVRKVLLGHIIGSVIFKYQYNTIKVFNDLTTDEKQELIDEIVKRKNL